jgi:hypothetical protein
MGTVLIAPVPHAAAASFGTNSWIYVAQDTLFTSEGYVQGLGLGGFYVSPNPDGLAHTLTISVQDFGSGSVWAEAAQGSGVSGGGTGAYNNATAVCFFGSTSYSVPANTGVYVFVNMFAPYTDCASAPVGSGTVGVGNVAWH